MIELKGVHKTFRSGKRIVAALKDVSFGVEKGMTVALVGKSGSGKTTLLNCIGGIEQPDGGRITCFGRNIHTLSTKALSAFQRHHIGFIFQHSNLLSCLSVFDNIAFPLILNGVEKRQIIKKVRVVLEKMNLSDTEKAHPHELSGGEIQRVSAARALVHLPHMILADEPTASLDTETGKNLVSLMFEIGKKQDCTMIISTHDPEIMGLAEMTIYLKDGKRAGGMMKAIKMIILLLIIFISVTLSSP